jgi:Tol biopolymer transport system component
MKDRVHQKSVPIHVTLEVPRVYLAPGSSATIAIGLTNLDSEEDVFGLSITGLKDEYVSLETPQVRLAAGEFRKINLTIDLPAGVNIQSGQYPFEIVVTSQNLPGEGVVAEGQLNVPVFSSEGRIGVLMLATQFSVAPGSRVTIPMTLINRGLEPDSFQLHVEGIPTGWISTPTAITQLDPGAQKEVEFSIQPPRLPESLAGRHPFTIHVIGTEVSSQGSSVDCILTVTAYSEFSCELQPVELDMGQNGRVSVFNQGNVQDTYAISFQSLEGALRFEEIPDPTSSAAEQTKNVPLDANAPAFLSVPPGERGILEFRSWPQTQPILGGEKDYPFRAFVESTGKLTQTLQGRVFTKALIPSWMFVAATLLFVSCLCGLFVFTNPLSVPEPDATQTALAAVAQIAGATETAAFNQTQAAIIGQEDADADGLVNIRELELSTDPTNPDTDGDELLDGDEVNQRGTDPRNPDTDGDSLTDGDEVLRRGTDTLIADTDRDGLPDGDEVQRGTHPSNPDTDGDGINDGGEVSQGTDPKNPDSDNDGLADGRETAPCPDPLNPDTDRDGFVDGRDAEPCDPNNPALTAAAGTLQPTQPPPPVTQTPPPPTQPAPNPTLPPLPSGAIMVFESNRDGNPDIYRLNLGNQGTTRLTTDAATDTQPAWSSDGSRIAFVSNRGGNSDIFVMNADGTGLMNVTNHPAEDTDPVWSPLENQIAFTSNRDGNNEIYVIEADGSNPFNLTNNPADDSQPTWFLQPTLLVIVEERIAFTSNRDGNQEVYTMKLDGSGQTNLTQHPANDHSPAGYLDAIQIAFVTDRDGNQEIYLMNTDGASPVNLTNHPGGDLQPAWLKGGEWLAFATDRDGNLEIYAIRNDASFLTNLTQNPAGDNYPALYTR